MLVQTACPLNEMTVVRGELPVSFYLGFSKAFDSDIYRTCIVKLKRQTGWVDYSVSGELAGLLCMRHRSQGNHLEGAFLKSET